MVTTTAVGPSDAATRRASGCPSAGRPQAPDGESATAEVVQQGSASKPKISMVRYPRPEYRGRPWSQWGQGIVLGDGRFVSGIGDHIGPDGNSFVFVYDAESRRLVRIGDILSEVDHRDGEWGFGKIHAQMVPGPCGEAYIASYWGTRRDLEFTSNYRGDVLFRLDPVTFELEPLGVPVDKHGISSLASYPKQGLVYGEAADPLHELENPDHDIGAFFVYDVVKNKMVFRVDDQTHTLYRNMIVGADGRAYIAAEDGYLLIYEPGAKELVRSDERVPGGGPLRASTTPGPDGTVYAVTQGEDDAPDIFFAVTRDGSFRRLGEARGYTTSLALNDDGSRFFYVPGAHGDSSEWQTPVIAVDTKTGEQEVVAELKGLAEDHLGLTPAGSYNVVFDAARNRLFVGLNAGDDEDDPWGEVMLAVIELP